MKLQDKIAIITGGAMGNGLGIVKVFLKYGATVFILDHSEVLKDTLKELKQLFPTAHAYGYLVDIRDKKQLELIALDIEKRVGHVNIIVNNAGVCFLKSFSETTDELRDVQFDINIKGTWNVTKAFLPLLKNPSSIINLSSVTGNYVADPGEVAYATTKAALVGFTKGLAADLADKGIRVNAILPGYLKTPMVEKMAQESNAQNPEDVMAKIAQGIPMKRMGKIEELGELAAFLASEEASYMTASTIVFDGGSTLPETNSMGV